MTSQVPAKLQIARRLVLLGRRLAAERPVSRCHAAMQQAIRGARGQARVPCAQIRRRVRHGRPQAPRPVNYVLARIIPPKGVEIDEKKRAFKG